MSNILPIPGFHQPFSSLSHLTAACVFAVVSVCLLWRGRGDRARMISLAVFCVAAVCLLSTSGIYHLLSPIGESRALMRRLDHAAIFVLIAGTFTPVHTLLFRGWGRGGALLLIWTVALVGIVFKMIYFHDIPRWLGMSLYLGMGWLGIFTGISLTRRFGFSFVQPLLWGGVAYTVGVLFEFLRWPVLIEGVIQWHEVFHAAVLIGLCCHWSFIYQIADGHVKLKPDACAALVAPKAERHNNVVCPK